VTAGANADRDPRPTVDIVGREVECKEIDLLLTDVRSGTSGALVLRGEAGMGKTTLLDYALSSATGMHTVRVAGMQSENEFSFGALHRLLVPFMDRIESLPARQREAIWTAFGVAAGPAPDRFLVGLAALTVLAEAARERPLICIVDDAHWIDRESLDVLGLIARRLFAERVVMLFAARVSSAAVVTVGPPPLEGVRALDILGLDEQAARQLITALVPCPVDPAVALKIAEGTGGCPLAVREVVSGLRRDQLSGHQPLPDPLTVGSALERHFLCQVELLPTDTQTALLLVAAESSRDPFLLRRACAALSVDIRALEPAREAELLAPSYEVTFRHPLIRSAVYNGAHVEKRRAAHLALAEATDGVLHPEARAWHLSRATSGPDEGTAVLLAQCAAKARSRGRYSEAAALWARTAELTAEPAEAARSLLEAAEAYFVGGAVEASEDALTRAEQDLATPLLRAQALRLDAQLKTFVAPSETPSLLLNVATAFEALDIGLARDTYAEALAACVVSAQMTSLTTPKDIAVAALNAPSRHDGDPTIEDLLLDAFATRFAFGYVDAVPAYRRCVEWLCAEDSPHASRWAVFGSKAAEELWDPVGYRVMLQRMERTQRQRGELDALRVTANRLGDYEMWIGQFALADAYHSETAELAAALGEDSEGWLRNKAELLAWQGRETEARAVATQILQHPSDVPSVGVVVNSALLGLAVLNIAKGQYREALAYARQLFNIDPITHGNHCLREVVEAGARAGDTEIACRALERLEERGQASGTPWALGLVARSRALIAHDALAEEHFREGLEYLASTPIVTEQARTHLLYGEWLRRQGRRTDARSQLQNAYALFADMGADTFAQRAARELGATGARARKRSPDSSSTLTPQELRIARLAASGATSKEIAAELFLSPRTIDAHLRSVFSKVGITSRRQLRGMPLS
jgi:DNA-binding CsgD family transcriptional regulator